MGVFPAGTFKPQLMPDKKKWIIITSGDQPIGEVSQALEKKGFTIDSTLDEIGQIIGSGTDEMKKEGLQVKGVSDILPSNEDIDIGPPDSDITW